LSAEKQGKYQSFHHALLTSSASLTEETVEKIAQDVGLDITRLRKDISSPDIEAALKRNEELAEKLGVRATPTFVVGQDLISGALSPESFQALIAAARSHSPAAGSPAAGL
jgi:protein-disulfide isomerase